MDELPARFHQPLRHAFLQFLRVYTDHHPQLDQEAHSVVIRGQEFARKHEKDRHRKS